jgi:hypothetical protein
MSRERLPNRRMQLTAVVSWAGIEWQISVGFDPSGTAREVFANECKPSGRLGGLVHDACIVLSRLLQNGERAADLVGRFAIGPGRDPSLIALLVAEAAHCERENGDIIRDCYRLAAGEIGLGPYRLEPAGAGVSA